MKTMLAQAEKAQDRGRIPVNQNLLRYVLQYQAEFLYRVQSAGRG